MTAKMAFRDASPSKYGDRSTWSDLRRRYFQQRYLLSWVLAVFFPFLVLRLLFFYDGSLSFSSPATTPSALRTEYIHRRPSYAHRHPSVPADERSSVTRQTPPFIRPDEDAWTTHDTWINNHQSSIRPKSNKPDNFFPSGTQPSVGHDSLEGSVGQTSDSFGLPEDNDKEGLFSWKRSEEDEELQAEDDRKVKEKIRAAELKEAEEKRAAELKVAEDRKAAKEAEKKRAAELKDAEEKKRAAELKEAEEKKKAEQEAEEEKKAAEHKEAEEEKKAAEHKEAEEKKKAAEHKEAEEKKKAAAHKEAEEKKKSAKEAEKKKAAEQKEAEEKKAAELKKEEERQAAETKKFEDEPLSDVEVERRVDDMSQVDERENGEQKATFEDVAERTGDRESSNVNDQARADEQSKTEEKQETETDSDGNLSENENLPSSEQLAIAPNLTALTGGRCDLFDGVWEYDPEGPLYTNASCFYIQGDQNCMSNGRPDREYLHWRWKPRDCDLPRFDAKAFLESFRGKVIGFVGDSLARNQMQSLLCMLSQVEIPDEIAQSADDKTVRWLYREHQVTLAVIWSPYLLKESSEGVEGFEKGQSVLYLDVLDPAWTSAMSDFHIIVLSIGQWYFKGSVYVKEKEVIGCHYCPGKNLTDVGFYDAYRGGVRQVLEKLTAEFKGIVIMSTFAISHFEHGPWENGGDCRREKPLTQDELVTFPGMHDEMHAIVMDEYIKIASDENRLKNNPEALLEFLDVTKISLLRADGHPGPYRRAHPYANKDPSEWIPNDCLHWCLPGPVDTWNQLLVKLVQRHL